MTRFPSPTPLLVAAVVALLARAGAVGLGPLEAPRAAAAVAERHVLAAFPLPDLPSDARSLWLARLAYPAGTTSIASWEGPSVRVVEAGALGCDLAGSGSIRRASDGPSAPPTPVGPGELRLGAGDALLLPAGVQAGCRVDRSGRAVVLVAAALAAASPPPTPISDAAVEVLGRGRLAALPAQPTRLAIERVSLPAGPDRSTLAVAGPALVVPERGTAAVAIGRGAGEFRPGSAGSRPDSAAATRPSGGPEVAFAPGAGFFVAEGAAAVVRHAAGGPGFAVPSGGGRPDPVVAVDTVEAPEPLVVLVLTVGPEAAVVL